MNEKLYSVAATLTDDERKRDRGAFFKSIHATMNHLLVADRIWMGRFTGAPLEAGWIGPGGIRALDQELSADWEQLRAGRRETDDEIERWVAALSAVNLSTTLRYARQEGHVEVPLWWAVTHLFNHQTHHRGQVTTLLMQAGKDPGVTDLIAMLRSGPAPAANA